MNLIDIASWQSGIDLNYLFRNNNLDGVIAKATQGTGYVNPEFVAWMKWLTENGKPFGMYHYCDGGDAEAEAVHFYNTVKPFIGRGIPVADYEGEALQKGTVWLGKFLEKFRALSGVLCMIYCSLSVIFEQNFRALTDYPLWIAQYADMVTVYGFLEKPWQKGSVSPFSKYWMHQYTSCGRLNGWGGHLDFDKFYGTVEDWNTLAKGNAPDVQPTPAPAPVPATPYKPADPDIVLRTLKNEFGIGTERIMNLREAGYDHDSVQKKINQVYLIASNVKKDIGNEMPYLNSILWIARAI